ncbi:MAG TPA: hypothetical protein VEL75_23495 [Candidatus Methylomirabilis sp.]|nr:hypothetical protein [Candidatus Methylomirabilis sp.]
MARWWAAVALLAVAGVSDGADGRLVDVVLAEIGSRPVTLSDVTLARALGIFGFEPSTGPITDADLTRYLDAQLAVSEAAQLAVEVPAADVDRAWEASGGSALAGRLAAAGIEPGWARRLLEANIRVERFIDVRFRAFAFVTDFDVDEALGPGSHDEAARTRTRARLEAAQVARAYESWKTDARQRASVRKLPGVAGPWPAPFSLGAGAGRK